MNNLVSRIFDAVRAKPKRGFPILIGPTQWGKTRTAREYARALDQPLVTINWQTETAEEAGGHPFKLPRDKQGRVEVEYTVPAALTTALKASNATLDSPFVFFNDEMDKAHNDTLSTLLTLTSTDERRLRHIVMRPDVLICGAMNEPQRELPAALVARMLMIPFPLDYGEYVADLPRDSRALVKKLYPEPKIAFPERAESPGSVLTLREWYDLPEFWSDERLRTTVIRGLFSEQKVARIVEEITSEKPVTDPVQCVLKWSPQALLKNFVKLLNEATPEDEQRILQAFMERAQGDKTGEVRALYDSFANEACPEPHAAVKFNFQLKPDAGEEVGGKKYYWTGEIGQAIWEREYGKLLKEGKRV